jgi:hypothetical protein
LSCLGLLLLLLLLLGLLLNEVQVLVALCLQLAACC